MFPAQFGGDPAKAKQYFEEALKLSGRRSHLIQVGYARNYAVNNRDRQLFLDLLNEVLNAPDQGVDVRLSNKVARQRAERYIQHVDDWFDPAVAPVAER